VVFVAGDALQRWEPEGGVGSEHQARGGMYVYGGMRERIRETDCTGKTLSVSDAGKTEGTEREWRGGGNSLSSVLMRIP